MYSITRILTALERPWFGSQTSTGQSCVHFLKVASTIHIIIMYTYLLIVASIIQTIKRSVRDSGQDVKVTNG